MNRVFIQLKGRLAQKGGGKVNDIIQPNFPIEIDGYEYLGRGSTAVDGSPGWSRKKGIAYRCANCGSLMPASFNDYYSCKCKAMFLDIDAGRFGSRYGDQNILVYRKD